MSNAVAKVAFLQGQAWAKAPDGTLRALTVGSTLNGDEILITAQGSKVELDSGNGELLAINGGLTVGVSRDLFAATATEPDEARLSDASVQEALTVLEQGGDLLDELEETAAGNSGGGSGSDGGSSFVRLSRLMESTDAQSFEYDRTSTTAREVGSSDGEFVNRAPVVTNQTLATNEDEPFSGRVIADDIEGDALTFTLSTAPINGVVILDPVTGQFTFTPNANYNGPESFVVTVTDSRGNATDTSITFNVVPVNDAPTTNDIALTTTEDVAVSGQVVAQDIEGDTLAYAVTGNPSNGTVTLNAATGAFVYTPNSNYNGSDSFIITISDGNGGTTTSTVSVGVTPVNDLPVAQSLSLTTDEEVAVNGQISASDIDGDTLGYTVSGNPTNGTVTMNAATGAFVYTPNANYNGSDSFEVTISDGKGGTTTSTVTIGVNPLNDAPVASDLSLTTDEEVAVNGQISASDIDGDTLGYSISNNPTNGTVVLNAATGAFVYTPNANYNGSDSFEVTISDGKGGTTTSTVTIGVNPLNDAPVASDLSLTTDEEVAVNGQISASDIDGDVLGYSISNNPTNGTVTLNAATGAFVYTPNANYNGSDSFEVTISDGKGGTTTSTVTIGVNPLNDAPVASDLSLTTDEEVAVNGQISASDIDGDVLGYSISNNPTNGTVTLNAATGAFVYTPNANYNGSDSFEVTISDGKGGTTTSTVTIGVNPLNDAPVASDLSLTTDEEVAVNGQISASDIDGDTLGYSISNNPTNGTVVLNAATGAFVYTPNANYNGSDSFEVTISDGKGGTTISTVTIGVNPLNDAPVASDLNLTTDEEVAVNGQISASDIDGDVLGYTVSNNPTNGTVTLNAATGAFVYTPNANYNGSDSFEVTISDGKGGTATSTVTIGVNPLNDAPVASDLSLTTDEEVAVNGQISASDIDGDSLGYTVSGNPTNGTVVLNAATGTFVYTPNANYNGSDSFEVTISDGKGGTTTSTVTIGVNPLNDAPVASDLNLTTDEEVAVNGQISASDIDGDTLGYTVSGNPTNGTVTLNAATGAFVYTPNANYNGSDSFEVTISDGKGGTTTSTVTIGVNPLNDAPVASDLNLTTDEEVAVNGQISASDIDGDALGYTVSGNPTNGTVVLNAATGAFVYTPNANYNGSDSFEVTISDGKGGTTTSTVTIGVNPLNDAPVASDLNLTTDEEVAVNGQISASDIDGDTLGYTVSNNPTNGTVTLNAATGAFVYTPNANYNGSDSFEVTISDGKGGTTTSTVTIGVNPLNDAPVAVDDTATTDENSAVVIAVRANDTDIGGGLLSVTGVTQGANGSVVIDAVTNNPIYTPNSGFSGTDTFTYTVEDGEGGSATATVTVTVNPVNDAPVLTITQVNNFVEDAGAAVGDVVATFTTSDADGDTVTVTLSDTLNYALSGNTVTLTAAGLALVNSGADLPTFTLTPDDGTVNGAAVSANPSVTSVNDAPQTNTVSVTGNEDALIVISLSGSDVDGVVAGYVIKSLPANGELYTDLTMTTRIAAGDLVSETVYFLPAANWNGNTSFSYAAQDNLGLEDATPATVSITVNPGVDAAILSTGTGSVKEDTPAQSSASGTLTISDPDGASEERFIAQTNTAGTYGNFSINAAGDWVFNIDNTKLDVQKLKAGEEKTETFAVASADGTPTSVTITVIGTNDGPVAVNDNASVNQGAVLTLTPAQLLGNDTDLDGDALSITSVQGASNGTVSLVGGNVVFTPNPSFYGSTSFTYTISDGHASSTATVNVNVVKTNNDPVANADSSASSNSGLFSEYFGYREGTDGLNLTNIAQINAFLSGRTADATFIAKTFDYGSANAFSNGLGSQGNLRAFLGSDAASMGATNPATTTDAIVRMHGFVALEAGTYNFKVTADDGYQIKVDGVVVAEVDKNQAIISTAHASFTLPSSGLHTVEVLYWDQANYARLKLELSSDGGTTYNSLGNFPVYQNASLVAMEDRALTIPVSSLLANDTDADGDTLSVTAVQGATNGTVSLVGGNVIFTPAANYSGPASFSYTISDGKGGGSTATVNLTIAPVNDAPVAVNDSVIAKMNTAITVQAATLLANDSDIEGGALTLVSVQNAVNGTVALVNGNAVFTPATNFEGIGSFTYTIRDNFGATSTATTNVTVGAASAPSVVVEKALLAIARGDAGTSVKFPITTQLVDADGSESLSIRVIGVPTGLSFNAGTNLGGGVWAFVEADLPNLVLNIPGGHPNISGTTLTVQVTSTEMYGGYTASVSSAVTLHAYKATDKPINASGNLNGTGANEYITGDDRDNVINGGAGDDVINGGTGNDTLSATAGSNIFDGGAGNDLITGGSGIDYIKGGAGNDTMSGGTGNVIDVFAWSLGDQNAAGTPAVDTINNFATAAAGNNHTGGDVLDLRDLLQGEHVGANNAAGNLADYLHFEVAGGSTTIHISHTGGFGADSHTVGAAYTGSAETQKIVLNNVDLQSVYSGAITDQQIITQLLNNNKLITD